jgi:hypothetical protein
MDYLAGISAFVPCVQEKLAFNEGAAIIHLNETLKYFLTLPTPHNQPHPFRLPPGVRLAEQGA